MSKAKGGSAANAVELRRTSTASPLESLREIVPLLAQVIGPNCEVVLHDFSRLPKSIVAIGGNLTHRKVGDTINPFALERIREGADHDMINYQVELGDGRILRSSTIFVRTSDGVAEGCLCVNLDVSDLMKMRSVIDALMVSAGDAVDAARDTSMVPTVHETFPNTVEEVMAEMVSQAIANVGVEPGLMHKRHKMEVVQFLEAHGLFLVRDAVDFVAQELRVTRYTIYNYLNEIKSKASPSGSANSKTTSRDQGSQIKSVDREVRSPEPNLKGRK
ncbi:MAG: hypothetical protein HIU84_08960 [Acidobacteria bacterium]|nr:hypothetical protein [Acidobacteriota bacterium]